MLPWQRGDISKLPKITILRWFFQQNWFQSAHPPSGNPLMYLLDRGPTTFLKQKQVFGA
jgi:hypothetical protein